MAVALEAEMEPEGEDEGILLVLRALKKKATFVIWQQTPDIEAESLSKNKFGKEDNTLL